MPRYVFPFIIDLAQKHLKKIKGVNCSDYVYWDKQVTALLSLIDSDFPARLSLYDQGIFQLGYYHQTQKNFEKKEEETNNGRSN